MHWKDIIRVRRDSCLFSFSARGSQLSFLVRWRGQLLHVSNLIIQKVSQKLVFVKNFDVSAYFSLVIIENSIKLGNASLALFAEPIFYYRMLTGPVE